MDEKMATAVQAGYGPGRPGWGDFLLGRAAYNDVRSLGETGDGLGSALLLIRAAVQLLLRAQLARSNVEVVPTASGIECWKQFIELPASADLASRLSLAQLALIDSILGVHGAAFLVKQGENERKLALSTLNDVAKTLLSPLESDANRVQNVVVLRWSKISAVAAVILLGLVFMSQEPREGRNLALNKNVTLSSTHPSWGRDPSQLVDGIRTDLGFHTLEAANQFATIDLGASYRIRRVVVYNRTECCQDRAVPLRIDVSENGKEYRKVAERTEPFQAEWTAKFSSTKARYVRLTDLSANFFHLNEVEVY